MNTKKNVVKSGVTVEIIEAKACCHVASYGDSYASIAALHKPAGSSSHEYALKLESLNNGKRVVAGSTINL